MNFIPTFKKLVFLSSISLAVATHAQGATFADSANTAIIPDTYQTTLATDSLDTSINRVSGEYTAIAEGFENTPEPASFNLDASAQGRSFSMLMAGLGMITYIVMRRRIKL